MDWIYINKNSDNINVNSNNVYLFSKINVDENKIKGIQVLLDYTPTILDLQTILKKYQLDYDKSIEVNSFIYNGNYYWFNKDERINILNSFKIVKDSNSSQTVTLWLSSIPVELNVDYAINFMQNLELYAIACNNTTKTHINQIRALTTPEEVTNFDITADYPERLTLIAE